MKFLREYTISAHAPAGGATSALYAETGAYTISTHAPAGGATMEARRAEKEGVFLLTPLREGRLRLALSYGPIIHFYSRPCGRGDHGGAQSGERGRISTHAPAGGATRLDRTVFFAPMATGTECNVELPAACVQSGPLFISADDFLFKGRDVFFWHDCTSIIPNPQIISRVYLKTHDVTGSEGFLRCARHFFAGILTYFKEK